MPAALLFDIDGVLVDVRSSYIDSIRRTVQLYLETIHPIEPSLRSLLTRWDVQQFKLLGGFNNDWDAVYGLLLYFQSLIAKLERSGKETGTAGLIRLKNLSGLSRKVPVPCGLKGIRRFAGRGTSISYELAKDMFQEVYLGTRLHKKCYGKDALFIQSNGLIHHEKLLIPPPILAALKKKGHRMGIVTGRTCFEAEYVLERFKIRRFFKVLVTHDDIEREEKKTGKVLRKPHPFPLLLAARKLGGRSFLYVGDLPDDIKAANRAKRKIKILSCAVLYGQDNRPFMKEAFGKAKADWIIQRPASLLRLGDRPGQPG